MTVPAFGTVHVWRFDLDKEALPDLLSADEQARAPVSALSVTPGAGEQAEACCAGHSATTWNCGLVVSKFDTGRFGKPSLPGCSVRFNVTHSGSLFLLAVADGQEVGIDAERLRSDFVPEDLASQVFSLREQQALREAPAAGRHTAFLSRWTAKEAYVKALGAGLSFPLPLLTLTPNGSGCYDAEDLSQDGAGPSVAVRSLPPIPGVAASLAAVGPLLDIHSHVS